MFSDTTVALAVIAFLGTIGTLGAPIINNMIAAKQRRQEKAEDAAISAAATAARERREDLVAERVDEAARQAKASAEKMIAATERGSETASVERDRLDGQLKEIHTLVNSNVTTQMQLTLTYAKAQLASMRDAIAAREEVGTKPSPAVLAALAALEESIKDQERSLAERQTATDNAAAIKVTSDRQSNIKAVESAVRETAATARAQAREEAKSEDKLVEAAATMKDAADTMNKSADKAQAAVEKMKP